ncbi:MAG: NF038143 family protein [Thermodesulfobacteriota bacterium]
MADLEKKYGAILKYEEQFAYTLGREVIDKPEASVWMILLPVLFVHHAYRVNRYKEAVRSFARGILDSRQRALDMARRQIESGGREEIRGEDFFSELDSASESDRMLAEKQLEVIRIQHEHYLRLLSASGDNYGDLIRNAYKEAMYYREFVDRLTAAEQDLNRYLTENVHKDEGSRAVVQRMEDFCADLRGREVKSFF